MNTMTKLIMALLCIFCFISSGAEPTPRWVKKGVKELDKERTNDSYYFKVFHIYDADKNRMILNRFQPLISYVDSAYNASKGNVILDSITARAGQPTTYILSFKEAEKKVSVYAQLVDSYSHFEDYADGEYEYNFWQLFAISNPDIIPHFDEFETKRRYNGAPIAMSLIPGLGQIYKGQRAKGYTIMGAEALLIGGLIYSSAEASNYTRLAQKHPETAESYRSKANTQKNIRLFCSIGIGGVYLYNLLDAAFSKGARYVEIKQKNAPALELTFCPFIAPDMAGMGFNIRF